MIIESKDIKPFLRWAGGKTWLVNDIVNGLSNTFKNYHEPFLGSAALFIKLKSEGYIKGKSFLNDSNNDLINTYKQIKNNPTLVAEVLKKYKNDKDSYYQIRGRLSKNKVSAACDFIYLNRTCFNGIYRVNKKGEFNVPYGYKNYKELFDYENIFNVNSLLRKNVTLTSKDFFESVVNINYKDLVFIYPQYTVNHENNGFIQYNEKLFSWDDQIRLKEFIRQIIKKKAYFILTNAAHESILDLFGSIAKSQIKIRSSLIGGKNALRGEIHEYIFSNYLK